MNKINKIIKNKKNYNNFDREDHKLDKIRKCLYDNLVNVQKYINIIDDYYKGPYSESTEENKHGTRKKSKRNDKNGINHINAKLRSSENKHFSTPKPNFSRHHYYDLVTQLVSPITVKRDRQLIKNNLSFDGHEADKIIAKIDDRTKNLANDIIENKKEITSSMLLMMKLTAPAGANVTLFGAEIYSDSIMAKYQEKKDKVVEIMAKVSNDASGNESNTNNVTADSTNGTRMSNTMQSTPKNPNKDVQQNLFNENESTQSASAAGSSST